MLEVVGGGLVFSSSSLRQIKIWEILQGYFRREIYRSCWVHWLFKEAPKLTERTFGQPPRNVCGLFVVLNSLSFFYVAFSGVDTYMSHGETGPFTPITISKILLLLF